MKGDAALLLYVSSVYFADVEVAHITFTPYHRHHEFILGTPKIYFICIIA